MKIIVLAILTFAYSCGTPIEETPESQSGKLDKEIENSDEDKEKKITFDTSGSKFTFFYSDPDFVCSDFSSGQALGGAIIMLVKIKDSHIDIVQSLESSNDAYKRADALGTSTESGTSVSGAIDSSTGNFVAQGTSSLKNEDHGKMRILYKIEGNINHNRWEGKYSFTISFMDTNNLTCDYKSEFHGSSQVEDNESNDNEPIDNVVR